MMQRVSNKTRGTVITMIALALLILSIDAAAYPSARRNPGMVWSDEANGIILFGGLSPVDSANLRYEFADTWKFTGLRWVRLYPQNSPSPRFAMSMVYDSNRDRVVLFGGAVGTEFLSDTWVFEKGNWTEIETPNAPSARRFAGIAFDPVRDRVVLFGGGTGDTRFLDTWEFDGTTWTRIQESGPQVEVPALVYDAARGETLMLGTSASEPVMYRYTGSGWDQIEPENMPPCAGQTTMVFRDYDDSVLVYGGTCLPAGVSNDTWIWDGTDWTELDLERTASSKFGYGLAYDPKRNHTVIYGGSGLSESNVTYRLSGNRWIELVGDYEPGPRTQFVFQPSLNGDGLWLYGGQSSNDFLEDMWRLDDFRWTPVDTEDAPLFCSSPLGAIDPERERLVLLCSDSETFEYDGSEWELKTSNDSPSPRRFSVMSWDPASRRIIMYGGIDDFGTYLDETWAWNGSQWTKLDIGRNDKPKARILPTMFIDPQSNRIMLAGGIGRPGFDADFERYEDQWRFDGSKWVEMNPSQKLPQRYGAQVALDPNNNRILVFGGKSIDEKYLGDLWAWNGTSWSEVEDGPAPPPRMNGRMVWDPSLGRIVLYGGYAGLYYSELWTFDGSWKRIEPAAGGPVRGVRRPGTGPEPTTGSVSVPATRPPDVSPTPTRHEAIR